jgi:hypothetical protein
VWCAYRQRLNVSNVHAGTSFPKASGYRGVMHSQRYQHCWTADSDMRLQRELLERQQEKAERERIRICRGHRGRTREPTMKRCDVCCVCPHSATYQVGYASIRGEWLFFVRTCVLRRRGSGTCSLSRHSRHSAALSRRSTTGCTHAQPTKINTQRQREQPQVRGRTDEGGGSLLPSV